MCLVAMQMQMQMQMQAQAQAQAQAQSAKREALCHGREIAKTKAIDMLGSITVESIPI